MILVASDVVTLRKRIGREYDDNLVVLLLTLCAQFVMIGSLVNALVKEYVIAVSLDGVSSVKIVRIG